MSNLFTLAEYREEVRELATDIVGQAIYVVGKACEPYPDLSRDYVRSQVSEYVINQIDSETEDHEWIIYHGPCYAVLLHSENEDYYLTHFGAGEVFQAAAEKGTNELIALLARWALVGDLTDVCAQLLADAYGEE